MRPRSSPFESGKGAIPRIALVFWDGYLGVAPSMVACIDALVAHGYGVDVLVRTMTDGNPLAATPEFDESRVTIVEMPMLQVPGRDRSWAESGWTARAGLLPRKIAKRVFEHADRLRFRALVRKHAEGRSYVAIIAVDDDAVAAAAPVVSRGVPLIYWSLELDTLADGDPIHLLMRAYAFRVRRRAALTIVQDTSRAHALARAGMPMETVRLVPNSPAGAPRVLSGRFFHDLFDLPPTQRVILHAGVMIAQTLVEEMAEEAASWPADWTLVFHDRQARSVDDPFTRRLEQLGAGRVRISRNPLPYRDVDLVFASADVALALYSDAFGENWALIAMASGKLAHALRVGVPVLCSALPGLEELVEESGCGVAIRDLSDSTTAIQRIFDDEAGFRARALACFRDHFDFEVKFRDVLSELDALVCRQA